MTHPDRFDEAVVFHYGIALIAYRETKTGAVYFPLDAIVSYYGFASAHSFFNNDSVLDELYSYSQQVYQEAVRRVWVKNKKQSIHLIAHSFLEQPYMEELWKAEPTIKPVPPAQPEESTWLKIVEQDSWSEVEFAYLMAGVFMDYGVPNQRTAQLRTIEFFAFDARTPYRWTIRLQELATLAAERHQPEVHLSELTQIEKNRINRIRSTAQFLNMNTD